MFHQNPTGHHFTSLLIHAANAVLLFLFLIYATGRLGTSLFVAALFALHPINVESVAWVAERKNVLCTFFFFAALDRLLLVRDANQTGDDTLHLPACLSWG